MVAESWLPLLLRAAGKRGAVAADEAVEAFEKTKLFTEASEHDQYLWNFHSHHEAVYPSSDSQLELFMQLFWYVRVVWPLFYLGYYYGYVLCGNQTGAEDDAMIQHERAVKV